MKEKLALLAFLLLLFGCTQQPQPAQEKTLADALGIQLPAPYSAFYSANVSSPSGGFIGTLSTYYSHGNFRADVYFEGMPDYSIFSINGTGYICTREGAVGNCTLSENSGSGFAPALSQPASLFSAESLPSRAISGIAAKCFSISPKNSFSYSASISCYSQQGVLLYSFSQDQKLSTITETAAISIGGAPQEEKFRLPYAVK
ncbi:Uncharacterised protein [Candidatus Anstonella stagnisolia]|nr:Uncharacterised protein [Candidatus Anstonella stagnisolia]